jgi:hypothetical protein
MFELVECMPRNTHNHWLGKLMCPGGGGVMDVQNKSSYYCSRMQEYSQTEHCSAAKQCDNVTVHQNHHYAHLLQNFKTNFLNWGD